MVRLLCYMVFDEIENCFIGWMVRRFDIYYFDFGFMNVYIQGIFIRFFVRFILCIFKFVCIFKFGISLGYL